MNIRKLTGTALVLALLMAPSCGNADLGEDESVSLSGVEDIIRFAARSPAL